jgi:hypothetical protein
MSSRWLRFAAAMAVGDYDGVVGDRLRGVIDDDGRVVETVPG